MARSRGKRSIRKNTKDLAAYEIRRMWGDLPVMDAKKDLRVFMAPEDVAGATRKDPAYCVFARACRRTFHATKVLFFRTVAYIELPDAAGNHKVERFILGDDMRALIEAFDGGKQVIPQAGFLLKAPTKGIRLDAKRIRNQGADKRSKNDRRKLLGKAQASDDRHESGRPPKGQVRDDPLFLDLAVRSGCGAVHFANPKHGLSRPAEEHKA